MLTSAAPSTSNVNGRLRRHRRLGLAPQSPLTARQSLLRPPPNDQPRPYRRPFQSNGRRQRGGRRNRDSLDPGSGLGASPEISPICVLSRRPTKITARTDTGTSKPPRIAAL